MKVLMATDGSTQSTIALETASKLLRREEMEFSLLCVAPEFTPPNAKFEKDQKKRARMIDLYREQIGTRAEETLIHAQARLRTMGIEAGIRTQIGSPARVIVDQSADYDIAVIGAHDQYTRGKSGIGPVASRVVSSAASAVLVGRELVAERTWRILVAVDGSLASRRAVDLMVKCLRVRSADITLMHVAETPWIHLGLGAEWFDSPREMIDRRGNDIEVAFERELHYEAEDVIEDARRRLEGHGLSVNPVISEGDPALEIISEAERGEYDLIVVGATGASDLKHHILGSVSTRVAQDAPCSVFVVKYTE